MTAFPGVDWADYRDTIKNAMASTAREIIVWKKFRRRLNRFSEDGSSPAISYDSINLYCLISYDDWRLWPYDKGSVSGKLDYGHAGIILNKDYLNDLGYLNANGYFDFDSGYDKFIIDGITYKPLGDTAVAQAGSDTMLMQLIVQREDIASGTDPQ